MRTFGIKQAKEASKFAVTKEQKMTVLATLAMLGLRNVVSKGVAKVKRRAEKEVTRLNADNIRLRGHIASNKNREVQEIGKLNECLDINRDWTL